jgi:molybdenum storage protein
MSKSLPEQQYKARTHIKSPFTRESLVDKRVMASTTVERETDLLPYVNIIGIGGRSILDRGRSAILPLVDDSKQRQPQNDSRGGRRNSGAAYVRHCDGLGIPTGGLAHLAGACQEQYEKMLQALLAKHGGIQLTKDHFWDIPHKLASGMIPIMIGMPPYHYWEQPPRRGNLPMNGSDFGLYIFAEALGARSLTFVKDVDGLYSDDPRTNLRAAFIPEISAGELLALEVERSCIDRMVAEVMLRSRHVKKIQIINGLKPGNLTRALNLEHVGTIVYKENRRVIASAVQRKRR